MLGRLLVLAYASLREAEYSEDWTVAPGGVLTKQAALRVTEEARADEPGGSASELLELGAHGEETDGATALLEVDGGADGNLDDVNDMNQTALQDLVAHGDKTDGAAALLEAEDSKPVASPDGGESADNGSAFTEVTAGSGTELAAPTTKATPAVVFTSFVQSDAETKPTTPVKVSVDVTVEFSKEASSPTSLPCGPSVEDVLLSTSVFSLLDTLVNPWHVHKSNGTRKTESWVDDPGTTIMQEFLDRLQNQPNQVLILFGQATKSLMSCPKIERMAACTYDMSSLDCPSDVRDGLIRLLTALDRYVWDYNPAPPILHELELSKAIYKSNNALHNAGLVVRLIIKELQTPGHLTLQAALKPMISKMRNDIGCVYGYASTQAVGTLGSLLQFGAKSDKQCAARDDVPMSSRSYVPSDLVTAWAVHPTRPAGTWPTGRPRWTARDLVTA